MRIMFKMGCYSHRLESKSYKKRITNEQEPVLDGRTKK